MLAIDFDLLDVARNRFVISTGTWAQAGQETPDRHAEALARPGASPMEMNGRRYEGFVRSPPASVQTASCRTGSRSRTPTSRACPRRTCNEPATWRTVMKLYGFPPSPNTWKVRAAAQYMGAQLELEFVDLTKGQQRTAEYLALNPCGRTPVLVDGDFTLWESNAILQYLGAKVPTPLWPEDARTRADIMRWHSWQLAHWHPAVVPFIAENVIKAQILKAGEPDQAVIAKATEAFDNEAPVLDAHLARHEYLVADTLTLADFAVAAPLFHAERAKVPLESYGNVRRWFGRQAAMQAWRDTAPKVP
jgi:glutathione S-transferase